MAVQVMHSAGHKNRYSSWIGSGGWFQPSLIRKHASAWSKRADSDGLIDALRSNPVQDIGENQPREWCVQVEHGST